ncbi:hypothetical protein SVAN01_02784 [Stagonosporopsis vannaccii]|nr:hypothetical protein SVAN01_02784 [Stagonosporopsis vannaccii]
MAGSKRTGKETMSLRELTARLHRNCKPTPTLINALAVHASALSQHICTDFKTLNSIVLRHEALIRQRWMKKTVAQRRKILLAAWPNMPKEHRPDKDLATAAACILREADGYIPDHFTWPFSKTTTNCHQKPAHPHSVNQEDLVAQKTLLLLLNSRARKAPWEFAAFEADFSPILKLTFDGCKDHEFCNTTTMEFTEAVDPTTYGKVKKINGDPSMHCKEASDKYDNCARRSFQALLIQQRILAFLLTCANLILQDLPSDHLLNAPVQEEPPASQIIVDGSMNHTSFTDVLNLAPYRGWDSLNFTKLRSYVQNIFITQKDHVWALREDPAYFADTVQDFLDHSPSAISSTCAPGLPHSSARVPGYHESVIADMLDESFAMLHGWNFINNRLSHHEKLMCDGATKQAQALPILELEKMATSIGTWLLGKLYQCSRAAPACRPLLLRECSTAVEDHAYVYIDDMTRAEKEVLDVFRQFHPEFTEFLLRWPVLLSFFLEAVDRLLQTSPTARRMISGRMMSLLTDLSIITEVQRQITLWVRSPEVRTGKVNGCGCNIPSISGSGQSFFDWNHALYEDFRPPMDLIMPLEERLKYPEHKKRGPEVVATMRRAESNLDRFWAAIDAHFENKKGASQYQSIRECLKDLGKIRRTAPSDASPVNQVKPTLHEYQPLPEELHNKAVQITGAFDRLALVDRVKLKTRGSTGTDVPVDLFVKLPPDVQTPERIFTVDKRTYTLFQTLLSASSEAAGEVRKSAKWADFKRAMVRMGFSAEKLQGSAWQFMPTSDVGNGRGIQFHEPHPDSEITYVIAKRMGRRLGRVYGWHGRMFRLA